MNTKPRKPWNNRRQLAPELLVTVAMLGMLLALRAQTPPPAGPPPEFDTNAEPKVLQATQINLSPELAPVVRLAQSGAEESIVISYIEKAPPYHLSADEIVYLKDLGISDSIVKVLLSRSTNPAVPLPTPTTPPAAPPAVPEPQPVAPAAAPPAPPPAVAEFYEPLTPYGTWIEVAPYGWCWQPSVVVINSGWRPYCDNGNWMWSDAGWYWNSHYSWGWAPFHYGRWFYHPHRRWVWLPERTWGPSWVSWRSANDYCGWAPLPPGAHFSVGIGWTFGGHHVANDFAFGLGAAHFTFVATSHFADRRLVAHSIPRQNVNVIYNQTTVINNYAAGPNQQIINKGVDRRHIETISNTRVPEVAVRELPKEPQRVTMPGQIAKVGKSDVVYRPGPKIEVPRKAVSTGQRAIPGALTKPSAPSAGSVAPVAPVRQVNPVNPNPVIPAKPVTPAIPSKPAASPPTPITKPPAVQRSTPINPAPAPPQAQPQMPPRVSPAPPAGPAPVHPADTYPSHGRQRVAPPNSEPPRSIHPQQQPKSLPKGDEHRE